jgi:hypothetical protein
MTSWVLIFFLAYDRSGSFATIQNLKSSSECERVYALVAKTFEKPWIQKHLCMEVINK